SEAVRHRMSAERTRDALAALGFDITDADIARAREERRQLMESIPPDLWAKAAAVKAEIDRVRANHGAGGIYLAERTRQIFHGDGGPSGVSP
ncbi:MAG: hypothetical protein J2P15_15640, partial [Micromonosporaceae bacterium]|nr:hypothetical protein [Micromonosporaceae bacterium]